MLNDIIACFEKFIGLFNICEVIDKTHIPVVDTFGLFLKFVWSFFFKVNSSRNNKGVG
jgi:hypothetical protein